MNGWWALAAGNKFGGEKGQFLAEAAISLPILALLFMAAAGMFWQVWQTYRHETRATELSAEIRTATERIAEDAARSSKFAVIKNYGVGGGNFDRVYFYREHDSGVGAEDTVSYFVHRPASSPSIKLCRNETTMPITGDNSEGEVTITRFNCSAFGRRLRVEISGETPADGQKFSLVAEFFFGDMKP